jgi:Protein of unknown function (DUF3467)
MAGASIISPEMALGTSLAIQMVMTGQTPSPPVDQGPLAIYANYCEVGHNAFEFLLDYGQFRPESGNVQVHSRIVTGPVQAKLFARMFTQAVERFEASHGLIADVSDEDALGGLIDSIPDFERRAMRARARPLPNGATAPTVPPPA